MDHFQGTTVSITKDAPYDHGKGMEKPKPVYSVYFQGAKVGGQQIAYSPEIFFNLKFAGDRLLFNYSDLKLKEAVVAGGAISLMRGATQRKSFKNLDRGPNHKKPVYGFWAKHQWTIKVGTDHVQVVVWMRRMVLGTEVVIEINAGQFDRALLGKKKYVWRVFRPYKSIIATVVLVLAVGAVSAVVQGAKA